MKNKKAITGCLVVIIIFFIIIFVGLIGVFDDSKSSISDSGNKSTQIKQDSTSESMAYAQSQHYVKAILKSPSSAKFPWTDYNYKKYEGNKYLISSYVDSQNSFGAMIRSDYAVVLTYLGGDDLDINNWQLEKMTFDGKLIYEIEELTKETEDQMTEEEIKTAKECMLDCDESYSEILDKCLIECLDSGKGSECKNICNSINNEYKKCLDNCL